MPVIAMLAAQDEAAAQIEAAQLGAVNVRDVGKSYQQERPLFVAEVYVGKCISEREMNGRDDSDFYMLVWDDATGAPFETCFASTRGWTYPSMGSRPDATPDVLEKYAAWQAEQARIRAAERARVEAVTPRKGKAVRVIAGRKVPRGTEAVVFWERIERLGFFAVAGDYWKPKGRIGLEVPGIGRVFVGADQVEVIAG